MERVRVLLLLHSLSLNGAPKVALDALGELRDHLDVRILALVGGPREARARELGPVVVVPRAVRTAGRLQPALRRSYAAWLNLQLRGWEADLIYSNSVASLPMLGLLRMPEVPVLLHVHELRSYLLRCLREMPTLLRDRPHRLIACSEAVRRVLVDDCGIPEQKTIVVHECIRREDAWPASRSARDASRLVIGGAGFPVWIKGGSLWVEMAAELAELLGRDRVSFVWVGIDQGELSWQLEEMARKLEVHSLIEFVPLTPNPLSHFARFDVFALTSWEDPCPLVVLENMMLETPVVCFSKSGGATEEIGDTGIAVEDFSPRQMAEAIAELANSPDRRYAMGQAARERVLRHFSAEVQGPKILKEIHRVVRTRSSSERNTVQG